MSNFSDWNSFRDLPKETLRERQGLYEIKCGKEKLKVGIAGDLWKRLIQHRQSVDVGLQSPEPAPWTHPDQVKSKRSILAKHLYFDELIAPDLDLRTEGGRQHFLQDRCEVRWQIHPNRESARRLEVEMEKQGGYRYQGRVVKRSGTVVGSR